MLKQKRLGKDARLITAENFKNVYNHARKFRHHGISLLANPNQLPFSRLGVSIAKRQVSRAVDRNRIRRILKEFFRLKRDELNIPLDIVFLVYASLLELNNQEIRECLDFLWIKLISFYKEV